MSLEIIATSGNCPGYQMVCHHVSNMGFGVRNLALNATLGQITRSLYVCLEIHKMMIITHLTPQLHETLF